jgi:hypothetical protein
MSWVPGSGSSRGSALSLVAAFFLYRASVRLVDWLTVPLYWIGIVLLIVTLIFGSGAGTAASVKGGSRSAACAWASRRSWRSSPSS